MAQTIHVDFDALAEGIQSLELLADELDEPKFDPYGMLGSSSGGSGEGHSSLYQAAFQTVDYEKNLHLLICNTIQYLKKVYLLKDADDSIADQL